MRKQILLITTVALWLALDPSRALLAESNNVNRRANALWVGVDFKLDQIFDSACDAVVVAPFIPRTRLRGSSVAEQREEVTRVAVRARAIEANNVDGIQRAVRLEPSNSQKRSIVFDGEKCDAYTHAAKNCLGGLFTSPDRLNSLLQRLGDERLKSLDLFLERSSSEKCLRGKLGKVEFGETVFEHAGVRKVSIPDFSDFAHGFEV